MAAYVSQFEDPQVKPLREHVLGLLPGAHACCGQDTPLGNPVLSREERAERWRTKRHALGATKLEQLKQAGGWAQ